MSRLVVLLVKNRWLRHHRALRVGRGQAALWHDTASRHRSQDRWDAAAWRRRRRNRLRVGCRHGGLGHHGGGGRVRLLVLVGIVHHGIRASARGLWRGRSVAAHGGGSVRGCGRPRSVRVARVHRHGWVVRLERWKSLVLAVLQVVGGNRRVGWIRSRRSVDHVRRVVVVFHNPTLCLP